MKICANVFHGSAEQNQLTNIIPNNSVEEVKLLSVIN